MVAVLLVIGMSYTQVQFGPQEWIGLVLLSLAALRITDSFDLFFVLKEAKKSKKI